MTNEAQDNPEIKTKHSRGIYLLPNLLTTAALFAGFYSIVAAMKGLFDIAAIAIFIAIIADGLDGRVARMTNTQTAFGAQYDSLSDMVSFGVAPALVIYSWSLFHLGKVGWLIAFIYTAAVALRLARFNTQVNDQDKRYFQGLSCTAAAGVIAGAVWIGFADHRVGVTLAIPVATLTMFISAFMVSSIRYHSFKQIDWKGKVPFFVVVLLVFVLAAVATDPPHLLFGIFFIYAFSGPFLNLLELRKMRSKKKLDKQQKDQ